MNRTFPTIGLSVVKGYSAIFGRALEEAASNVDLPAFGNPTRPMSAIVFNSSITYHRLTALFYLFRLAFGTLLHFTDSDVVRIPFASFSTSSHDALLIMCFQICY